MRIKFLKKKSQKLAEEIRKLEKILQKYVERSGVRGQQRRRFLHVFDVPRQTANNMLAPVSARYFLVDKDWVGAHLALLPILFLKIQK